MIRPRKWIILVAATLGLLLANTQAAGARQNCGLAEAPSSQPWLVVSKGVNCRTAVDVGERFLVARQVYGRLKVDILQWECRSGFGYGWCDRGKLGIWIVPDVDTPINTLRPIPKPDYWHRCGNTRRFAVNVRTLRVSCSTGRKVIRRMKCVDADCFKIRSGRWTCGFRYYVGGGSGKCRKGRKRVVWNVVD